jgi:hypothetical protein
VTVNNTNVPDVPRRLTIRDRIEEARELFRRENYELPLTHRRARANAFVATVNAVAGRHEGSE